MTNEPSIHAMFSGCGMNDGFCWALAVRENRASRREIRKDFILLGYFFVISRKKENTFKNSQRIYILPDSLRIV